MRQSSNKYIYYLVLGVRRALGRASCIFNADFRPIFVCGAAGAGTTLLAALIDQNYAVALQSFESHHSVGPGAVLFLPPFDEHASPAALLHAMLIDERVSAEEVRRELMRNYMARALFPRGSNFVVDKAAGSHLVRAARLRAAFPESDWIVIYRDPVEVVEGWRRKWSIFRSAPLEEVCSFYRELYSRFIEQSSSFRDEVQGISYRRLIDTDGAAIQGICERIGLGARKRSRAYLDRPDIPGKGLRNVRSGRIQISRKQAGAADGFALTREEEWQVREELTPIHETLTATFGPEPAGTR